ncbi:MAG: arylsulfatase B [Planctomycetota bacterium]|jgi:arylsulfatase B
MSLLLACLPLLLPVQSQSLPPASDIATRRAAPNIIVIVADDFGVDMLNAYGEGTAPACTPNIDALASQGMLFRNAWTNPICSPTRAALLTGRYGFRTGIGTVVGNNEAGLPLSEEAMPEMLLGYASTAVGKWHLSGNLGLDHPRDQGFDHFAGFIRGAIQNYFQWPKVVDGANTGSSVYSTTDIANEAINAVGSLPSPWYVQVNFNAPHSPWHVPPTNLCPGLPCANNWCGNLPTNPSNREMGKAMVEAMDTELGRILASVHQVDPNAIVVFMGDNGTPAQLSEAPFLPNHAKGTMFEGGVNVPLIISGPGILAADCNALVSSVDLFATFAQLAHVRAGTEDSVSMVPYFHAPHLRLREMTYTETFSPNGGTLPFNQHSRCVREERYKLIRITGQSDQLYDLQQDPFETNNLLPGLNTMQQDAFDRLLAEFVRLGVD